MSVINFFVENINDLLVGAISTFVCFIIAFMFCSLHRIKISKKIALGVNVKKNGERRLAWKFKIANRSIFTTFVNFDIKLTGINYIRNSDNTLTQHRGTIEVIAGIRKLTRYIPKPILFFKRLKNPNYTISFAYRPLTFENLNKMINEYEELELSVSCADTLTGRTHVFTQNFTLSKRSIFEGSFTNDGNLNKILPLKEDEEEFVKEHENESNREDKENESNKNSQTYTYKNHVSIKVEVEINECISDKNIEE